MGSLAEALSMRFQLNDKHQGIGRRVVRSSILSGILLTKGRTESITSC